MKDHNDRDGLPDFFTRAESNEFTRMFLIVSAIIAVGILFVTLICRA